MVKELVASFPGTATPMIPSSLGATEIICDLYYKADVATG